MNQYVSQEEVRRIIISDMVKKRNSIVPNSALTSMKERGHCGLPFLPQSFFDVPLVLLWLSYGAFKLIQSAYKEGLMFMRGYMLLVTISLLPLEVCLVDPRTYIEMAMNVRYGMLYSYFTQSYL